MALANRAEQEGANSLMSQTQYLQSVTERLALLVPTYKREGKIAHRLCTRACSFETVMRACPFLVIMPIRVGTSMPRSATIPVGSRDEKSVCVAVLDSRNTASLGMYLEMELRESKPTRKERGMTQKMVAAEEGK